MYCKFYILVAFNVNNHEPKRTDVLKTYPSISILFSNTTENLVGQSYGQNNFMCSKSILAVVPILYISCMHTHTERYS